MQQRRRFRCLKIDGKVIVESGAILTYLVEREGSLARPMELKKTTPIGCITQKAPRCYHSWSSLLPVGYAERRSLFFIKPIVKAIANKIDGNFTDGELTAHFGWIEKALEGKSYRGDVFSAADIQMSYPIQASFARSGDASESSQYQGLARPR